MKKTRFLIARCLTLLVLALLSTNLAWGADTWEKLTSVPKAGDVVILVNETAKREMTGISTTSTKYGIATTYTTSPAGTYQLTVCAGNSTSSLAFKTSDNKYLQWSSGNSLSVSDKLENSSSWTVTVSSGNFTITNVATNTRVIKYNKSGGQERFACYTSEQEAVQMYKKQASSKELVSLAVSGTPDKTTYEAGEEFDPAGLVVTGTYSEGDPEVITSGITWNITPSGALTVGTTSVSVTATVSGITSPAYVVNDLTVTAAQKWAKVTADKTDWSGEYLLVYENNSTAYVWTGVDAAKCNATATISNNQISKPTDAVSLTIAAMDCGYSILVNGGDNNGQYISGTSGSNTVNFGNTALANTLAYSDGNVTITSNTSTIMYNSNSGDNRFRYYKSGSSQKAVQLYEKVLPPTNEAVTFVAPEGGSLVIKNGETPIASGATIQNGTVLDVTFGMTPAEAYKDVAIKVTKTDGGDDVTSTVYNATKKQITMPRYAITVAVTFTKLYKISLVTAGEGTGSATMNGVTTDIYVDDETQIDLVANAVAPNEFTSWSATEKIMIDEVNKAETYAFASGDGTITATFGISALLPLDAPTLSEPTNITYSGVTLNWEALDNAEAYNVELLLNDETVASDVITGETTWTPEVALQANTTYTYTVQGVGDGITYAEDNNPKAQSTVTTADYPAATLTLSVNGITRDIAGKLNTPIDLPTTSTQTSEDKVFVGWSATTIDGETDEEPSLLGETYTFTNPEQLTATIYAVYAKETKGEVQTIFSEDFDACDGTGGNDGSWSGSIASKTLSITGWTFTKGSAADKCAKFGTSSDQGSAQTPTIGFTSKATLTFRAGAWSGDSKTLNITTTSGTVTPASVTLADAAFTSYEIVIIGATENPQITFAAAQASKNRFFLDDVVVKATGASSYSNYCTTVSVESVPVTVNPIGNASFCSTVDLNFTDIEGIKAYIAVSADNDKITLNRRNKIPAGTGIFVIGTGGTYDIPTTTDACDDVTGNMLTGTIVPYTVQSTDNIWALSKSDGLLRHVANGVTIGAGKAYMNEPLDATSLSLFISDEPTGINSINENVNENENLYNLQGIRVTTPKKGEIYIMNGKKFLMK